MDGLIRPVSQTLEDLLGVPQERHGLQVLSDAVGSVALFFVPDLVVLRLCKLARYSWFVFQIAGLRAGAKY